MSNRTTGCTAVGPRSSILGMAKRTCRVVFRRDTHGPAAILMYKGNALNVMNYPRGYRLSVAEARKAKAQLMRGCAELMKAWKRGR